MLDMNMAHTEKNETSTPGLLRLPTELRLIIYNFLRSDKSSEIYQTPDMANIKHPVTSCRLLRLPLMQVCRLIRHEAIPIWYGQKYLHFDFAVSRDLDNSFGWLRHVDLYSLTSMKGVTLQHCKHLCKTWSGDITTEETIVLGFGEFLTCATASYMGGCCDRKIEFDKAREVFVRHFKRRVEAAPESIKIELIRLVRQLFSFDRELSRGA